jgi:hypothetical protein
LLQVLGFFFGVIDLTTVKIKAQGRNIQIHFFHITRPQVHDVIEDRLVYTRFAQVINAFPFCLERKRTNILFIHPFEPETYRFSMLYPVQEYAAAGVVIQQAGNRCRLFIGRCIKG